VLTEQLWITEPEPDPQPHGDTHTHTDAELNRDPERKWHSIRITECDGVAEPVTVSIIERNGLGFWDIHPVRVPKRLRFAFGNAESDAERVTEPVPDGLRHPNSERHADAEQDADAQPDADTLSDTELFHEHNAERNPDCIDDAHAIADPDAERNAFTIAVADKHALAECNGDGVAHGDAESDSVAYGHAVAFCHGDAIGDSDALRDRHAVKQRHAIRYADALGDDLAVGVRNSQSYGDPFRQQHSVRHAIEVRVRKLFFNSVGQL
jgi:hypothetical protein